MTEHRIVSAEEWRNARRELLAKEKAFTQLRDELSRARRDLPWERVEKSYAFEGPRGTVALGDLFDGRHQLIVYHFMFDPAWETGCKSCSFWADNFNGITAHLRQRDTSLVAVSRAPLGTLQRFAERMGWSFPWFSSAGSDFNVDYHVSFTPDQLASGTVSYNYDARKAGPAELPGISVFYREDDGRLFHTYSCYARGLDMLNGAYHYLDLTPKGRDENGLPYTMAWLKLHDEYEPPVELRR
ncbi:MAG: thioredoxin family protein [Vicinamibacterales bacterium]